jgi:Ca-activated chloride channel family protein
MRTLMLRFAGAVFLACAACLSAFTAQAQDVGAPTLQWHDAEGRPAAAASHSLAVTFKVSGLVAEGRLSQQFRNTGSVHLEGQYLLPLPEGAAVHSMRLRIGQRVIEAEIREREQARAEYRAAAAAGKRTSLVEKHQGNLFRTAVANVAPGETVEIEIDWWQPVEYADGRFTLAFPLTFVPRYDQGLAIGMAVPGQQAAPVVAAPVAVVAPPQVTIAVELDPGLPLQSVSSESHAVDVQREGETYRVALGKGPVPADRDFVLRWRPEPGQQPTAALFVEHAADADYAMVLMLAPDAPSSRIPRELVLVIDTSGSMTGTSIEQAKAALDLALASLQPQDHFGVIQFNSTTEALFEQPVPATPQALRVARDWVALLEAQGGTEMLPALDAALSGSAPQGTVRQVVFATDGAVSGEDALYTVIEDQLGGSRLFPVGIGDAPNGYFLRRAARMGRGSSVVIRDVAEVQPRMAELFAKLDRPALRDVQLAWNGSAEAYPARVPDLYSGEPLVVVAKLARGTSRVDAVGWQREAAWSKSLDLARTRNDAGIARLWAQSKIEDLEEQLRRGGDEAVIRAQALDVALAHKLVTRWTSLVAVDRTPVRSTDAPLAGVQLANGATANALAFATTATSARQSLLIGLAGLALLLAAALRGRRFGAGSVA